MAKYDLFARVTTGGKFLGTVEADSQKEAIEKGWKLDTCFVSVCHQCAEHISDPEIDSIEAEKLEE